jgi:CRP-like cAMP-binding protein
LPSSLNASDLKRLEHVKFLTGVDERERDLLLEVSRVRHFTFGQSIFQLGDPADAFFIVLSGWAVLFREQLNGERTVIHLFGPGDSLAEALILPGSQYPASAEAASELRVLRVPTARFRKLIEDRPQLALSIISATFKHLKNLVDRVERDNGWSVERRTATFLLSLCADHGPESGPCQIELPVEQQLLAAHLSMTPATFSRALRRLSAVGVEARRGRVVIHHPSRLRVIASGVRSSQL